MAGFSLCFVSDDTETLICANLTVEKNQQALRRKTEAVERHTASHAEPASGCTHVLAMTPAPHGTRQTR